MKCRWLGGLTALALSFLPLLAPDTATAADRYTTGPLLGLSLGHFDVIGQEAPSLEGRLELRANNDWWLKPFGGIMSNTDRAAHIFAGVYAEFFVTDHFYLSPSFAPGLYMQGHSRDLGYPLEFRSEMEFGWRFENGIRASVSLNHISNAGLGQNPGTESAAVSLLLPLSF